MENIKTATRWHYLDEALPASTPAWFLSHPVQFEDGTRPSHYAITEVQPLGVFLYPVDVLGNLLGGAVAEAPGALTHEEGLRALGYTLAGALVVTKPKTKRTPARTHLNVADIDHETGKPTGRKPACGQLNGTRTDRAQTHYTTDTAQVTCQRCITTKLFARAMADEFHAIDRKAWAGALEDHKDLLERLRKERAVLVPAGAMVEVLVPEGQQAQEFSEVLKTYDITEGVSASGTFGVRADGSGIDVLDFSVEGGAQ